jgi:hypothetical protein
MIDSGASPLHILMGRSDSEAQGRRREIRLKVASVRAIVTVTDDADEGVAGVEQGSGAAISSDFSHSGRDGHAGGRDGETFVLPMHTARVSDSYDPVTAGTSDVGASYHALMIAARRRTAGARVPRGLDVVEGDRPGPEHRRDTEAELTARSVHGALRQGAVAAELSAQVRCQRDVGAASANDGAVAQARGERLDDLEHLLRDQRRPYSYEIFGGTRMAGGRESSNGSGGAVYLLTSGRNTLRLPVTMRLDMRMARGGSRGRTGAGAGVRRGVQCGQSRELLGRRAESVRGGNSGQGSNQIVFQDARRSRPKG